MKKVLIPFVLLAVSLSASCGSQTSKRSTGQDKAEASVMVGNDADSHGCKASAGYVWSVVMNDCVRTFEQGVQMTSLTDPVSSFAAYVLFSADSSRAEAFIPNVPKSVLLDKRGNSPVWDSSDNGLTITWRGGKLELSDPAQTLYRQSR